MNLHETTLSSETLFTGRILTLRHDTVQLPNGNHASREVIEHPGGVCVCAVTDEDTVLLVEQFRYPYGDVLLEVPAGKLERGEDPLLCGQRELHEETGCTATTYHPLGVIYPSPGYVRESIYLYYATGLTRGEAQPDEDEFLRVVEMPLSEAVAMAANGEIRDAKTIAALLRVWHMRKGA